MVKSAKILRVYKPGKSVPLFDQGSITPEELRKKFSGFGQKLMKWEAHCDLSAPGSKKFDAIKEGDKIVDYQNVKVTGYLSTFKNYTESDRQGDYVEPGAFRETIKAFMRNPVLLVNHRNAVENMAGKFTSLHEDSKGLKFEAELSNSPTEFMRHVRALVAEGALQSVSMGGIFHYKPDGKGIEKVHLFEGSLVPIPANPDALFSVRECTEQESKEFQAKAA